MRDNSKKTSHVGADLEPELADRFRFQVRSRKFKMKEIMQRWLEWWTKLEPTLQQQFYHWDGESEPILIFPDSEAAAIEDEAAAARDAAKQKRKPSRQKRGASA